MASASQSSLTVKYIIGSGIALLSFAALLFGSTSPAHAGSSFSIGIGTGGSSVVYRSWSGGGYRHWHDGYWDRFHVWHAGSYYGPVVWSPPANARYWSNGGPRYYHTYHNGWARRGHGHWSGNGHWR